MYDKEREIRRWEIFDSLPHKQAMEFLDTCNRHDRLERSIDRNSQGWFQPVEIFKGWLFVKFLMFGLPIIALILAYFNHVLVINDIIEPTTFKEVTGGICKIFMLMIIYEVLLKRLYHIRSLWVAIGLGVISLFNPSESTITAMMGSVVLLSIVLFIVKIIGWIFSKK